MKEFNRELQIVALSLVLAGTKLKTADSLAELIVARKALYETLETFDELIDTLATVQHTAAQVSS